MEAKLRILILEDRAVDAELTLHGLSSAGYELEWKRVDSEPEFLAQLDQGWELILADYNLPQFTGLQALELMKARGLDIPLIIVSGTIGEDKAVAAMKAGAGDYVMKNNLARLAPAVDRELCDAAERRERKRAEESLRQSDERYRLLVEASPDGIGIFQDEKIVFVNPTGARQLGARAPEELVGLPADRIIHPDDYPAALDRVKRRMAGETGVYPAEVRYLRLDGTVLQVEVSAMPMTFGGKPAVQFIARDIAARKRAEKAVHDSRSLYLSLVENLPQSVFRKDLEGRFLFCNRRFCEAVGRPSDEIIGQTDADLFPDSLAKAYRQDDLRVMESGQAMDQVEEQVTPDGRKLFVQVVKTPLRDATGGIIGVQGIFWDITERRRVEDSNLRLATVVEQAAEAVMITDAQAIIQYVNPAFEKITGYSREEAIGQNPRMLRSGQHDAEFYRLMWTALAGGEVWRGHLVNKRKDGSFYEEDSTISPVRDAAGRIVNYVAVKRDVTEHKILEAQMMRAQRLESIGVLAGGIAHDLNNILAPVLMAVHLLREQTKAESAHQLLSLVETNAHRGAELVKQILTFARGSQSKLIQISPKHLLVEVAKIAQETFPRAISVHRDFKKDIWSLLGDPTHLHQVLMNLSVNARDAMPYGGILTLRAANVEVDDLFAATMPDAKPGPYVLIEVTDTGSGIDQRILDKIFDPFFTTKGEGKGTGLGLSTVLGIVKGHRGFLTVDSRLGRGTTFKVYLPALPGVVAESNAIAEKVAPMGRGELILVVDDEEPIRHMAQMLLSRCGYEVEVAANGPEAIVFFARECDKVQVVITDLMMPFMPGEAVIQGLKKIRPQIRIIASSGGVEGRMIEDQTSE